MVLKRAALTLCNNLLVKELVKEERKLTTLSRDLNFRGYITTVKHMLEWMDNQLSAIMEKELRPNGY